MTGGYKRRVAGLSALLKVWSCCMAVVLLAGVIWPLLGHAENSDVTIGVGDTSLVVNGQTSPTAFVTILDNQAVIGTTSADNTGAFTKTFSAFTPGVHHLSFYGRDNDSRLTDTVELEISVAEHFQTSVAVFLPPTVSVTNATVDQGQPVQIRGSTIPSGQVTVILDNESTYQTLANAEGIWQLDISTANLTAGNHVFYAVVTELSSGKQSHPTREHTLTLLSKSSIIPPPLAPGDGIRPPPPVITYPQSGAVFTDNQLTVRGTSQPFLQIELFNGQHSIGSTFANSRGDWQIPITLTESEYELRARACLGRVCSDFSVSVRIFYQGGKGFGDFTATLEQFRYTYTLGEEAPLRLRIFGGRPPYKVNIQWGNGHIQNFTTKQTDLMLSYVYPKTGQFNGATTVQDQEGRFVHLAFSVGIHGQMSNWPFVFIILLILFLIVFLLLLREVMRKVRNRRPPAGAQ